MRTHTELLYLKVGVGRLLSVLCIMLLTSAYALAQVAAPRQIAACGNTDPNNLKAPNEPVIAAGPDRVISIFNRGYPEFGSTIGFAVAYPDLYDPNKWTWTEEGVTPDDEPFVRHVDPSLIHVPDLVNPSATGRFVAAALAQGGEGVI